MTVRRALGVGLAMALLWGAWFSMAAHRARADAGSCPNFCVILIEVNGLEPKDVSPATTPFLWGLAHPGNQGDTAASGRPGLSGRAGHVGGAARGGTSPS